MDFIAPTEVLQLKPLKNDGWKTIPSVWDGIYNSSYSFPQAPRMVSLPTFAWILL